MDERRSDTFYLAPGASGGPRRELPGAAQTGRARPRIDEHLVEPEQSRLEIVNGVLQQAFPARPPHGDQHARLDLVIGAHVRAGYRASADLLTRVDEANDFATDTCIRKEGTDPATGDRYLEELAFEVKHTQRLGDLKDRARVLLRSGVRRFFVVCVSEPAAGEVTTGPVLEWIPDSGTRSSSASAGAESEREPDGEWRILDNQTMIDDPCLARPLEVAALLDAVSAEIAVGRALIAKENPAIVAYGDSRYQDGKTDGYQAGKTDGLLEARRDALRAILAQRDLAPSAEHLARIDACRELDQLDRWLLAALVATRASDMFRA
jgi:hypothetical protein